MRILLTAATFLFAVSSLVAQASDQVFDSVRETIRTRLAAENVPSLAVAVARDGKILWEEGFGWADREQRIAADANTLYSLASISKPFTATGLMVLQKAGKIDLDRPVNDYLGAAKLRAMDGGDKAATVRSVANHSSGLPLHYQFFYEDEPYRPPTMEETIQRYGILLTPPGERYEYSNLGFGILGYVIARVSRRSYEEFMRDEVFVPLGLDHTSVGIPAQFTKRQAIRYGTDGQPLPFYDFDHRGASAIYSSAHDLVRFGLFHLKAHLPDQKPILSDDAIGAMQRPTIAANASLGYGIGWMTSERNGYATVYHTGSMGGVRTLILMVPAKKIVVVALSNSNSDLSRRVADDVLAALLPDWKGPAPRDSAAARDNFVPPPELIGTWTGSIVTWEGKTPLLLDVSAAGQVHSKLGNGAQASWQNIRWTDGVLTGQVEGEIPTADARRRPHTISFRIGLRGSTLAGAATAISKPSQRPGSALTSWVELKRQSAAELAPVKAIDGILKAFETHTVVAMDEHPWMQSEGAFFSMLAQDPRFADVGTIVVNFGNSLYQPILDRYIRGDKVSFAEISKVWRNTTQLGVWEALTYQRFYESVREVNQKLPPARRLRVLAGDPPIDWDKIKSRDDAEKFSDRNAPYAEVLEREVYAKHKKAFLIQGGNHLTHGGSLNGSANTTSIIEKQHPGSVYVVLLWWGNGGAEVERRLAPIEAPALIPLHGSWLGALRALPISRRVPNPPPAPYPLEAGADAMIYFGPLSAQKASAPSAGLDAAYLMELNRRSQIMRGKPFVFEEVLETVRQVYNH